MSTFSGISINKVGVGYTLSANSGGITSATSNLFNITPAAASKLAFTTQPSSVATAGVSFASQAVIQVQDTNGNAVTNSSASITLNAYSDSGCTIPASGTLGQTSQSADGTTGNAAFTTLSDTLTGTVFFKAASGGLTSSACSTLVSVAPNSAYQLIILGQPSTASASSVIVPAIELAVQDTYGNVVTGSSASLSISILNNAGPSGVLEWHHAGERYPRNRQFL